MRQLKFGIEIEFYGVSRDTIAEKLEDAGLDVEVERYNHATNPYWKLTTDRSVTSTDCCNNNHCGNELVSPILYDEEGLEQLKIALNTLKENGAKVNYTCGIHVHHDIHDYSIEDFKNLLKYMYNYNVFFDALMPSNRRDNTYCASLTANEINTINACTSIEQLETAAHSRYKKINVFSYKKYGTIEFRQHQGSLDYTDILNWIELTFRILCYCKNKNIEIVSNSIDLKQQLFNIRKDLNIMGTATSKFISNRIKKYTHVIN